jgi:hypothetical protein
MMTVLVSRALVVAAQSVIAGKLSCVRVSRVEFLVTDAPMFILCTRRWPVTQKIMQTNHGLTLRHRYYDN